MFFDKISLVHAVIKHYTIFAEAPAEARFFFLPENFWKFGKINFVFFENMYGSMMIILQVDCCDHV